MVETMKALEIYRSFAEDSLAMPVIAGEKPENERFPGAVSTFSIEAMMQDGKALQAGTSHFLGQHFSRAQNIRFQNDAGELVHCYTTSWGLSTRMVGGVIMTHGDDDGLRLPPVVAPRQIVIVPMLRDKPEDAQVLEYCESLRAALLAERAFGERLRVLLDTKATKSADKRWNWVRRGAPLIVEIGPRDAANGQVTFMRRDDLRAGDKVKSNALPRDEFVAQVPKLLAEMQANLFKEAKKRLDANIRTDVKTFDQLAEYFGAGSDDEDASGDFKGWVRAPWSKPGGAELDALDTRLKQLKLTLRNAPADQGPPSGKCLFTGKDAVEEILIARAY
jgi:prolyl-tRNA synthetase